ncbi:XRE family transcriptional regulator [Streptomyces sp. G45]|uniref:MmyB family transcriptional regulator n=1 Tax=Streptomyces sp. G45 TaxID=3406627 RepID=UPI003C25A37F
MARTAHGTARGPHPIGALLAPKRQLIRPEWVGLPPRAAATRGPRQEGLRQVDMDALTGRAERTCNRLERGQLAKPSADYLAAVARILRLSPDEYVLLWLHARGQRPTRPLDPTVGLSVPDGWQEACDGHRDMMYVTDLAWTVLAHNQPFADMFTGGRVPRNTARWALLSEEARATLIDWEQQWVPSFVTQLRAAVAENPDNEVLRRLVADVHDDPVAGPLYAAGGMSAMATDGAKRRLRHALYGNGVAHTVAATPHAAPGARVIMVHFVPDAS